jgi:hypothetical protein
MREVLISHVYETDVFDKPEQKHEWKMLPLVKICTETGIPVSRVKKAVYYWEKLGYKFDGIYESHLPLCSEPKYGEIVITIPESGFSDEHMAATRLYTSKRTQEIIKAKIFILPKNAKKERVIEHEIGHALGWGHHSQQYHIMHRLWRNGGYDSYGLRKDT